MPHLFRSSWTVPAALCLLSLVPVAAGVVRLAGLTNGAPATAENARFVAMPLPVVLHIASAVVFCLLGAFQFDAAARRRFPGRHRLAGRVVAPCGLVAALTGLWMTAAYRIPASQQGSLLHGVRMAVGVAMAAAIVLAVRAVLRGQIARHRAWMVRAYALGQGAGTQVLIILPVALVAGAPTFGLRDVLMSSAWGLNLLIAEILIRRRAPSH